MNLVERFITPRSVIRFYDESLVKSPWFWLLTILFGLIVRRTVHLFHANTIELLVVLVSIASVWVHLIVQHSWFQLDDPQTLKKNAAKTTLAFSVLYLITVSILLK
jgi:hypothetical protein